MRESLVLNDNEVDSLFSQYVKCTIDSILLSNDFCNYSTSNQIEKLNNKIQKISRGFVKVQKELDAIEYRYIYPLEKYKPNFLTNLVKYYSQGMVKYTDKHPDNPIKLAIYEDFIEICKYYVYLKYRIFCESNTNQKECDLDTIHNLKFFTTNKFEYKLISLNFPEYANEINLAKYKFIRLCLDDLNRVVKNLCTKFNFDKKFRENILILNSVHEELKKTRCPPNNGSSPQESVDLHHIRSLDGYTFEIFLKILFEKMGFNSILTSKSKDQGCDLIISRNDISYCIQAKNHKNNVGNSAIQEVRSSIDHYKANKGFVISTSGFTDSAFNLSKSTHVELINGNELSKFMLLYPITHQDLDLARKRK